MASLAVMSEPAPGLLAPTPPRCTSAARPINGRRTTTDFDFSAYLLSASPPGFDLAPGVFSCGRPPSERRFQTVEGLSSVFASCARTSVDCAPSQTTCRAQVRACSPWSSAERASSTPNSGRSSLSGTRRSPGLSKKVSFADDLGMLLEQIRIFSESSDTPPNISPKVLRRYGSADDADPGVSRFLSGGVKKSISAPGNLNRCLSSGTPVTVEAPAASLLVPKLVPNFAMPAADRSSFLERVDRACVSLESVRVLPGDVYPVGVSSGPGPPVLDRLVGSVAVKNVAFEKSVTARCTFDGWASLVNARAVYARSERAARRAADGRALADLEFDVFEFSVNLPTRWRALPGDRPRAELAVRYDVAGRTFWDNNAGQNFELVGTADSITRPNRVFSHGQLDPGPPCWSEFSGWNDVDTSCPYW